MTRAVRLGVVPRNRRRAVWAAVLAVVTVVAFPAPARADTSQSTATAVGINLLGTGLLSSGTQSAQSDGSSDVVSAQQPLLSVLGTQNILQTGSLVQTAEAFASGLSAACAGVVGNGGSVVIAPDGGCTVNNGTGGLRVSLGGLLTLQADAIIATCTATASTGATTASARLVNARILGGLTGNTLLGTLNSNPGPNSSSNLVPLVATIDQNVQTSPVAGQIAAKALHISLVSGLADISLAGVTCGPNIVTVPTPSIPWQSVPVFLAVVMLAALSPPGRRLLDRSRTAFAS